jgi:hypothetical protein
MPDPLTRDRAEARAAARAGSTRGRRAHVVSAHRVDLVQQLASETQRARRGARTRPAGRGARRSTRARGRSAPSPAASPARARARAARPRRAWRAPRGRRRPPCPRSPGACRRIRRRRPRGCRTTGRCRSSSRGASSSRTRWKRRELMPPPERGRGQHERVAVGIRVPRHVRAEDDVRLRRTAPTLRSTPDEVGGGGSIELLPVPGATPPNSSRTRSEKASCSHVAGGGDERDCPPSSARRAAPAAAPPSSRSRSPSCPGWSARRGARSRAARQCSSKTRSSGVSSTCAISSSTTSRSSSRSDAIQTRREHEVGEHVERLRQVLVEHAGLVAGVLPAGVGVERAAEPLERHRDLGGGATLGALEDHVLEHVAHARIGCGLVRRALAHPDANGGGAHPGDVLAHDLDAVVELRPDHRVRCQPSGRRQGHLTRSHRERVAAASSAQCSRPSFPTRPWRRLQRALPLRRARPYARGAGGPSRRSRAA